MKDYIEERAVDIANYIIEEKATVRQTAKKFGVSKSTVHMVVTMQNGWCGRSFKGAESHGIDELRCRCAERYIDFLFADYFGIHFYLLMVY